MKFLDEGTRVEFSKFGDDPANTLRLHERLFKWQAEPWHFALLKEIAPEPVYGFFGHAKKVRDVIYFNNATKRGKFSFKWVKDNYRAHLFRAMGNIEIRLAEDGEIHESFFTGSPIGREYCTPGEIALMFDLARKALAGQKVNAAQELENFRRAA
jgi:hypothetical protein